MLIKGGKSIDDLENVCDGIQNVETMGSDNVGDDDDAVNQDGTLTLRFTGNLRGSGRKKNMNCKQPTEKRLGASAFKIVGDTVSLEKDVSPVCRIKFKVWTTIASGTIDLQYYKK